MCPLDPQIVDTSASRFFLFFFGVFLFSLWWRFPVLTAEQGKFSLLPCESQPPSKPLLGCQSIFALPPAVPNLLANLSLGPQSPVSRISPFVTRRSFAQVLNSASTPFPLSKVMCPLGSSLRCLTFIALGGSIYGSYPHLCIRGRVKTTPFRHQPLVPFLCVGAFPQVISPLRVLQ